MAIKKPMCFIVLVCAFTELFFSCNKTYSFKPIDKVVTPLQALINSDTALTYFYATMQQAGDSSLYAGIDSAIVILPTNRAFQAAGLTLQGIKGLSKTSADSILKAYYIPGPVILAPGSYNAYTNKLGAMLYGYGAVDTSGSFFNNVPAQSQSVLGSNATVLTINQFLSFSLPSISDLLSNDTSLVLFNEAVKHTGFNLLPASDWNTVLAPIDSAFMAAGYPDLPSIDNANTDTLLALLRYHLIPGQYYVQSFTGLSGVVASNGDTVHLSFATGAVNFYGGDSTQLAAVLNGNRIATGNVVLHTINNVIR